MEKQDAKQEMNKVNKSQQGVLFANGLKYMLPSNISLNTSRAYQQNFADQQSYVSNSGTELVVRLQSSQGYVYGPNSYISFDVLATGAKTSAGVAALGFLRGDASALFLRYLLESKDGSEIERVEQSNIRTQACLPWLYPANYARIREMAAHPNEEFLKVFASDAEVSEDNGSVMAQAVGVAKPDGTVINFEKLRVCVPMSYFSGLFACESLIPAGLISGMLLRLTLETAKRALSVIATGDTQIADYDDSNLIFTITDPVVNLDVHNLSPVISKNLMEMSQKGLPYPYTTWYNQLSAVGGSSSYVVQINKAVSRACRIWTLAQDLETDNKNTSQYIDLGTSGQVYKSYQTRIGSLYMPYQPINIPGNSANAQKKNGAQLYINSLQAINAISPDGWHLHDPKVSKNDFCKDNTSKDVTNTNNFVPTNSNNCVIIQTLEQSAPLAYSGVSINSSRTAEQRIEFNDSKPANQQLISFLEYVKVAVVYPVKTIIKE